MASTHAPVCSCGLHARTRARISYKVHTYIVYKQFPMYVGRGGFSARFIFVRALSTFICVHVRSAYLCVFFYTAVYTINIQSVCGFLLFSSLHKMPASMPAFVPYRRHDTNKLLVLVVLCHCVSLNKSFMRTMTPVIRQ